VNKCPGRDSRMAQPENITCLNCGHVAEIFSDEFKVECPKCKNLIRKERSPSCLDWCKAAKDCIGEEKRQQFKK